MLCRSAEPSQKFRAVFSHFHPGNTTPVQTTVKQADREDSRSLRRLLTGQEQDRLLKSQQQTEQLGDVETEKRSPVSTHRKPVVSLTTQISPSTPKLDADAQRILRAHFARQILTDLRRIQQHCGKPTSAVYADSLLRTMRSMRDLSPFDPYLEVAMALYDALAYQNRWFGYNASQFKLLMTHLRFGTTNSKPVNLKPLINFPRCLTSILWISYAQMINRKPCTYWGFTLNASNLTFGASSKI